MSKLTFLGDVWLPNPCVCATRFEGQIVLNLESPITRADQPAPGKICLKAETNHLLSSFGQKPLAVCLANNHIMDHGVVGLNDTLAELDRTGIQYFGAGALAENCRNPLVLAIGGVRVGMLGYVCPSTHPNFVTPVQPGVKRIHLPTIRTDISALKSAAVARIVVMLHWGLEEVHLPRIADIELARSIIDAGADLIIGHHSHCIQRHEIYRGRPIFYGLGNCIFPDFGTPDRERNSPSGAWKKQRSWNRESLAVTWDVASGEIACRGLLFARDTLKTVPPRTRRLDVDLTNGSRHHYGKQFAGHVRHMALRLACSRFLANPMLPRARHLRMLFANSL